MISSQNVLFVIDDDLTSLKAVAVLALSMKMKCETFVSAEEFLNRYDSSLTGCALVDFRLQGMNGLQLQERLRAKGSSLAVILVSAYAGVSMADVKKIRHGHLGLQGIQERARLFGGKATIKSAPGEGTCVSIRIPLALPAATLPEIV